MDQKVVVNVGVPRVTPASLTLTVVSQVPGIEKLNGPA